MLLHVPYSNLINLYESRTIEGIFELTLRHARALYLASSVSSGSTILRKTTKKNSVRCAALGAEVQGLNEEQLL